MKKTLGKISVMCIGLLLLGSLINASAQTYQVTIYPPNSSFSDTTGSGIGGEQRAGAGRIAGFVSPLNTHALLWIGDNIEPIDLHPSSAWTYSALNDTDGTQQGGYVEYTDYPNSTLGGPRYAAIWSGTPQSFVQLCGITGANYCGYSEVKALFGNEQVGYRIVSEPIGGGLVEPTDAPTGSSRLASIWHGTAESFMTLHPRNTGGRLWSDSWAAATDGVQQVGDGVDQSQDFEHRNRGLLWSGTRESYVDLSPPIDIYNYVYVTGVKNNVQVGRAFHLQGCADALVWHGTAESYRVLDTCASARATNGTTHVGSKAFDNYYSHATRWDEATSASFDLHSLLPASVYRNSSANRIDEAGNIIGTAQNFDGKTVAVVWKVNNTPNAAPQITMNGPNDGEFHKIGQRVGLSANAQDTDGSIASVEFYINNKLVGTKTGATDGNNYSMVWIPRRNGTYMIQARATDNLGATTMCQPVSIRVNGVF